MNDDPNQIPGDGFMQPAGVDEIIIHAEPRISANKLAEFVIADHSRQKTIIREAKFAKKVVMIPYRKTRASIPHSFSSDSLNIDNLVRRAEEIERENEKESISEWQRNDNSNSSIALKKIAAIAPELLWKNARILHGRLGGLAIAGVKVSIQPELVFTFEHRNINKVGAIIINTAKGDEKSLARNNGAYCVGDYLTSLLFQMLLSKAPKIGTPLNSKCYAVDVFREKVYTAPASFKTLNKNLVAACEVIALRWPETKQRG
jgi:hypothetical protein